jgi:hypothetical protein
MLLTPDSLSPVITARLIGAAPRQRGKLDQRRHREVRRAHEDQTERHARSINFVMAGHSPSKTGVKRPYARPSTLSCFAAKAWMPGIKPGMTVESAYPM